MEVLLHRLKGNVRCSHSHHSHQFTRYEAKPLKAVNVRRVTRSNSCAEYTPVAMMLSLPETPEWMFRGTAAQTNRK
jgi:hypothetical protein